MGCGERGPRGGGGTKDVNDLNSVGDFISSFSYKGGSVRARDFLSRKSTSPSPPPPTSSPSLIPRKSPSRVRVRVNDEVRVVTTYFPLPPNAIVLDPHPVEDEERQVQKEEKPTLKKPSAASRKRKAELMLAEMKEKRSTPPPPPSSPCLIQRNSPSFVRVRVNGEEKLVTTYFPLPPNAIVIDPVEDKEMLPQMKKKRSKPPSVLTAAERRSDIYRRVSSDNKWQPPTSPHDLLQEHHYCDPWRVLVICILLNKTSGKQVKNSLEQFFHLCPNAEAATKVDELELMEILKPLGFYRTRTQKIKRFSDEYLTSEWTHVTQLHGVGKYAADAYAMFCLGESEKVKPNDHKLVHYWKFLCENRAQEQQQQSARESSEVGIGGTVSTK